MKKLFVLLFISGVIKSQDCFNNCLQRLKTGQDTLFSTIVSTKKAVEDSVFSPLEVNRIIINSLIGCQFPQTPLRSIDEKTLTVAQFKGKPVFIHFWFTSCPPCVAEIETLNELNKEFSNKAYFLAVNTDDMSTLKEFLKEHPYNSIQLNISREKAMNSFCLIGGYPTCIILNADNKVSSIWSGGNSDSLRQKDFYLKVKSEIQTLLMK